MIVQRRTVNYASITPLVRCDSSLQWLALSLHFCNLTGRISTLYSLMQYSSYQTLPKPSTTQYFFWRGQNSEICFTKHVQTDKNGLYNLLAYMSHDAFKRNHTSTPYWPKSKFPWPNTMIWITNYYKPCEVKKCTSDKSFDKRIYRKPCKSCALFNIVLFFQLNIHSYMTVVSSPVSVHLLAPSTVHKAYIKWENAPRWVTHTSWK